MAKIPNAIALARRPDGTLRSIATFIGPLDRKSATSQAATQTKKPNAVGDAIAAAASGVPNPADSAHTDKLARAVSASDSVAPRIFLVFRALRLRTAESASHPPTSVPTNPAATVIRPKSTLARPGSRP